VEVTDKNGLKGTAKCNQRVRAPKPEDPYAAILSTPADAGPKEPVIFDASRSIDPDGDPCKTFVFDFGDGSNPVISEDPVVKHSYDVPGTYPVNVTVTDKHGNRGNAALQQKLIPSIPITMYKKTLPRIHTLPLNLRRAKQRKMNLSPLMLRNLMIWTRIH